MRIICAWSSRQNLLRCSLMAFERIYQDVKNTDLKYKNRVRSRLSNLKDSKNPDLRKNVLCGVITPEQIAVMSSEVRGQLE